MSDLEVRISESKAIIKIGDLPTLHADAMQMRQLLQNLIANALRVPPRGCPAGNHTEIDDQKSCQTKQRSVVWKLSTTD